MFLVLVCGHVFDCGGEHQPDLAIVFHQLRAGDSWRSRAVPGIFEASVGQGVLAGFSGVGVTWVIECDDETFFVGRENHAIGKHGFLGEVDDGLVIAEGGGFEVETGAGDAFCAGIDVIEEEASVGIANDGFSI